MYVKCGELKRANEVFEALQIRDVISWSSIIAGYAQHGHGLAALSLFNTMQEQGIQPEKVTFLHVFKACSLLGSSRHSRLMHDQFLRHGIKLDAMIGNTIVDMYAKCGSLDEAQKLFECLPSRTIVSWNVILTSYSQQGLGHLAFEHFEKMQQEGVKPTLVTFSCILKVCASMETSRLGEIVHDKTIREHVEQDNAVGNALIDMYGKCGRIDSAFRVFSHMSSVDVVSWGALIAGYTKQENCTMALISFQRMLEKKVEPDSVIITLVLKACGGMGVLKWGKFIYDFIIKRRLEADLVVGNSLIDMYARCGSLLEAEEIFDRLKIKNVVSWNALIAGYAQEGYLKQAMECFKSMQQLCIEPTTQTFTSILAACTHAGVKDGYCCLRGMLSDHGVLPNIEHLNCIVDLIARAGNVEDAEGLLNSMPSVPNISGWMCLLTSCLMFGNVELGKRSFDQVIRLENDSSAGYILMLNIYANAQMWDEVLKLHQSRSIHTKHKKPGQAFVEVNCTLYEFTAGDLIYFKDLDIYTKIQKIARFSKDNGFVPHAEMVFESTFDKNDDNMKTSEIPNQL
ncbi:hypothetical protein KP509_10G063700 [Ceratopteris richardii]|nr:hypothetical protein KP509_10G063700 [Ceratopteris richardii]